MPTNEMALAKAFRDAGFEQEKAETLAETIFGAIRDNVATKADVELVRTDLRAEIASVRADLRAEIALVRTDLHSEITLVKADVAVIQSDLRQTELRLKNQIDRTVIRLGALQVVLLGILFAALRYWPPHMTP